MAETKMDFTTEIHKILLSNFGKNDYNTWLKGIKIKVIDDFTIELVCSNSYVKDYIRDNFMNNLVKKVNGERKIVKKGLLYILQTFYPKLLKIEFSVENIINKETNKTRNSVGEENKKVISSSVNDNLYNVGIELNKNYTFDNFIVGDSNNTAYEMSKYIADNEKVNLDYNPLFLYGSVGVGKTHLLQSIAWKMKDNFKHKRIVYITAEKFMFLFIQALRDKTINEFQEKFRNIDCLIVDDIQFIVEKEKTQLEFFYTFKSLISAGKQVVLACDRSPVNLNLDEKLKSRLNGGLIVDIKDNDFQLRYKIIKAKSKIFNLDLSEEMIKFLTDSLIANTREIEGCLKRLNISKTINKVDLTQQNIEMILNENIVNIRGRTSINSIQEKVASFFGISVADLTSNKRLKNLVIPRHIAMYLSRELLKKSFPEIAKHFNRRNHATVINAIDNIKNSTDLTVRSQIDKIIDILK